MDRRTAQCTQLMCQIFSFQRASAFRPSAFALAGYCGQVAAASTRPMRPDWDAPALRSQLVENTGIEPVTSCVQSRRSPS